MATKRFALQPGNLLGRHYQVIDFLGQGWEGEVYKVEERNTGIIRAAKLYYKHHSDAEKIHIEYAKKLFRLRDCPIIIQYHHQDIARINKQYYNFLVSEFVDGEVLSDYIHRQPQKRLIPFQALHLFYSLVKGVEHIHFSGEYHGDIHQDNIILKHTGLSYQVHLIDVMHLGKSTQTRIQQDVYDLMSIFYDILGGVRYYKNANSNIKKIICGRKHQLIRNNFKSAGDIRLFLENLEW